MADQTLHSWVHRAALSALAVDPTDATVALEVEAMRNCQGCCWKIHQITDAPRREWYCVVWYIDIASHGNGKGS